MEEYQASETELIDVTELESSLRESIRAKVHEHSGEMTCSEVRLLKAGNRFNLTLTCQVEKSKTLEEVHRQISEIESMFYRTFPLLRRITIHAEPKEAASRL